MLKYNVKLLFEKKTIYSKSIKYFYLNLVTEGFFTGWLEIPEILRIQLIQESNYAMVQNRFLCGSILIVSRCVFFYFYKFLYSILLY